MYCAYITTINDIRKHSNADKLQCCTVFGNNVIVDLTYQKGQRIIYFPTDGQLSEAFALNNNLVRLKDVDGNDIGGYLDPSKRNVKAIKLRGEQSDGLVLPIEVLSKYGDISVLKDGDQIDVFNGVEICKKYIPISKIVSNHHTNKKRNRKSDKQQMRIVFPFFDEHTDTKQLAYNKSAFKKGDTCYITLKMHGTSNRTAYTSKTVIEPQKKILRLLGFKDKISTSKTLVSGTRRTILKNYDGGYYGSNEFRKRFHDILKDKLFYQMELYYELVGWQNDDTPIMAVCDNKKLNDKEFVKKYGDKTIFSYGCKQGECDMYVYRATVTTEDGLVIELPWEQVQIYCEKLGIKCVPTFDKFIFTTWDNLMKRVDKFVDGVDPIGLTHIREGVVVRIDNSDTFKAYKHKNFSFKVLESIIKDTSDAPDIEEAEETLCQI